MNIYFSPEFFIDNRYLVWYKSIIQNALIKNQDINEYTEKHHILPKSIFPEFSDLKDHKWNQVKLTYREHFLAHWLLTKCVSQKKHTIQMNHALNRMREGNPNHTRVISSWQYNVMRRANKRANNDQWNNPEFKASHCEAIKEIVNRPEVKAKRSKAQKAAQNKPEYKEKQSKAQKKAWSDPELKKKHSELMKELMNRPEIKTKRKETNSRPEIKEKRSKSLKEAWSDPELKKKQSNTQKEIKNSPEWRAANTFYCECCDRLIVSKGNWFTHLRSKKHLEKCEG